MDKELIKKWRLILGPDVNQVMEDYTDINLTKDELEMDEALAAIYDDTTSSFNYQQGAGKGPSSMNIARWLGDIRKLFAEDLVTVIQNDAIEKKGLKQILFEPETLKSIKPDINLLTTFMSLSTRIPEKTKHIARELVKEVVDEINKKLESELNRAVVGALNKKSHSPIPNINSIDWKMTIRKNIKNYNIQLNKIIPERYYFFDRVKRLNKWTIIIDIDTSGSMGESIIYSSLMGCILSKMSSLKTHVVAFDTEIIDLTDKYGSDPVEMIFGIQLGGGTDINKSVAYCEQFITNPKSTIFIMITDLYEGGNETQLIKRLGNLVESEVKVIGLMALSDQGNPAYNDVTANKLAKMGVPCFACTPNLLPELIEGVLKGYNLFDVSNRITSKVKKN